MSLPEAACTVRVRRDKEAGLRAGFPWIYAGDAVESSEWRLAEPGSPAAVEDARGGFIGIGYVNPRSAILCRLLTRKKETIDTAFFAVRITQALERRARVIDVPYYRLIHSEADYLPGLVVDRYGEYLVVQCATAGMQRLEPLWLAALEGVLSPRGILLRADQPSRKLEGLKLEVRALKGELPSPLEVVENGFTYFADPKSGQKTGWFYDQRDNRRMIAHLSGGRTVADIYSHSGGFGLLAAQAGAKRVLMVDSSRPAIELARLAAQHAGLSVEFAVEDALAAMDRLAGEGRRFNLVLADPPAFVKKAADVPAAMKAYEKVARRAAALVEPGGRLYMASCSHHAQRGRFNRAVQDGVRAAGRKGVIEAQTCAAADHPLHPQLPQSEYLKGVLLTIT